MQACQCSSNGTICKCPLNIHKIKGPSIKYVTLFLANFYPPSPLSHFVTHPGTLPESTSQISDTPPIFRRLSTKNQDKSPLVQILSQLFAGVFVRGVLSGGLFMSGRFCPGWFLSVPILSECICYIRKLNITLNFMFHMYDKKIYKCDVTCSLPPSLCHKLSHLLGPPPPRA